ncbi:ZIP family metal transporter [Paenibacillus sp. MMS20-IR301]|uniref:ZIP family metal transporter n=1 Tax=Paenibacillus sp. MMS20-IR301 TaxID=2895946 RepID=UPI0028E777E8|nr:ZIP family metal transporter [Paenibacillus sp. MMS20-IR301]WNS46863.1 ZIP family metal transporter [Paenibacillus sp. MMS20-IR301]
MWSALTWGAVSGSAVLIGALLALFLPIPGKLIGFIMAFGTGVLIGAAAYELLEDSANDGGLTPTLIGFTAGALVFTLFDWLISRRGGAGRKRSAGAPAGAKSGGLAIFAGTVLDAIPESIMIGASLISGQGVSLLLVIAIFISNIPEGLSSTAGLKQGGYGKSKIVLLWLGVLIISTAASGGGYLFMDHASEHTEALIASFAGGGIIAMVSSSMMPEAYEDGGPLTGFIAAMGLLCSLVLDQL